PFNIIDPKKIVAGEQIAIAAPGLITDRYKALTRTLEAAESSTLFASYSTYASTIYGHTTKSTVITLPSLASSTGRPNIRVVARTSGFLTRVTPNASDRLVPLGR